MNRPAFQRTSGAALLLVLWAIFVLTGAVMVYSTYIRQTLITSSQNYNDTDARGMANSGMALGLHPLVTKETPVLAMKEADDDKRAANYKVATEKCDSLGGDTKIACMNEVKARFGKI